MELKFYEVTYAMEKVGCVPQVETIMEKPWTPIVEFVSSWDTLSDTSSIVYPLIARTLRTKFTDVLSCYNIRGSGVIISEKLKNILSEYNFGCQHQYIKVSIVTKKKEPVSTPYYYLHLPMPGVVDKINYPKSNFYEMSFADEKVHIPIQINSYDEERHLNDIGFKKSASYGIKVENIVFKRCTDPNMDIFVFVNNHHQRLFMVSERLKLRLERENVTGIVFVEYP